MKYLRKTSALLCLFAFVIVSVCLFASGTFVYAAGDLDEILDYEITADVNSDATVSLTYHIDWKVLDSDSEGPLSWVRVGIANSHFEDIRALSDTIKKIDYDSSYGPALRIDFDRDYYKDEVVSFDFLVVQDYLYEVNHLTEGETVYSFTPGWFDSLKVDSLTIRWNSDKITSWSPSCTMQDGYHVWKTSLGKGDVYTVDITYPNDAFAFDESKSMTQQYESSSDDNPFIYVIAGIIVLGFFAVVIWAFVRAVRGFVEFACFGISSLTGRKEKKITRTKIEYYPVCQGCGAPRPEGKENCEYCGRSFIKSKEVIEEADIPAEEAEIKNKRTNGTYRYAHDPNTYIHVSVLPIVSSGHGSRGGSYHSSGRSGGGSRGGGCAHSSCACACACACAGGGRAGCSVKDFYKTNVKLEYFK